MRHGKVSRTKDGNLIVPLWLIFDSRGNVRLTRTEPATARNERAMQLTVTVPEALFKTPTISATLTIDAPEVTFPEIDVVAAADALKNVIGCDIDVRVTASGIEGSAQDAQRLDPKGESPAPKGDAQ